WLTVSPRYSVSTVAVEDRKFSANSATAAALSLRTGFSAMSLLSLRRAGVRAPESSTRDWPATRNAPAQAHGAAGGRHQPSANVASVHPARAACRSRAFDWPIVGTVTSGLRVELRRDRTRGGPHPANRTAAGQATPAGKPRRRGSRYRGSRRPPIERHWLVHMYRTQGKVRA